MISGLPIKIKLSEDKKQVVVLVHDEPFYLEDSQITQLIDELLEKMYDAKSVRNGCIMI